MWDTRTGERLNPALSHQGSVFAALFSPSGGTLLTASSDHTARLWESSTRAPFGKIMKHHDLVRSAAFSPDGRLIVTGSDDHTARFWDATTGNPFGPPLQHPGRVSQVTFSPDGRHILTACDQSAWLWTVPGLLGEPRKDPVLWIQVITGMQLDEAKETHVLQASEWERRRQILNEGNRPAIH